MQGKARSPAHRIRILDGAGVSPFYRRAPAIVANRPHTTTHLLALSANEALDRNFPQGELRRTRFSNLC